MSDPPQQTDRCDSGTDQLVRLIPERELERNQAKRAQLAERVDSLEAKNRMLKLEILALKQKLEQKDNERQQVIDNYERILTNRERDRGIDGDGPETDRSRLASVLSWSGEK